MHEAGLSGTSVFATVHSSSVLRAVSLQDRMEERARVVDDLRSVAGLVVE